MAAITGTTDANGNLTGYTLNYTYSFPTSSNTSGAMRHNESAFGGTGSDIFQSTTDVTNFSTGIGGAFQFQNTDTAPKIMAITDADGTLGGTDSTQNLTSSYNLDTSKQSTGANIAAGSNVTIIGTLTLERYEYNNATGQSEPTGDFYTAYVLRTGSNNFAIATDRQLTVSSLSTSSYRITASANGGTLSLNDGIVEGTAGADLINENYAGDPDFDRIDASDNTGAGVTAGGVAGSNDDLVQGFGGNDTIRTGLGNDTVYAGHGADSVVGGDGNDVLHGFGDTLNGADDNANDTLRGEAGDDYLSGGGGNDALDGGVGADTLLGGSGNDLLTGGDHDDYLVGGTGNDTIYGDGGNDSVLGGDGADSIFGGDGADTLGGGNDNDTIDGGSGADKILGDGGDDVLSIGATPGNDTIIGGETNETAGIGGGDRLSFDAGGADSVTFTGNEAGTAMSGGGTITFSEIEIIQTGAGNDTVSAAAATTTVVVDAGTGNDWVQGGAGSDSLLGDAGTDTLSGGAGNDTIRGGDGNDAITGGDGADTLDGEAGDDHITVGRGDVATGGAGDDDFLIDTVQAGSGSFQITGGETAEDGIYDPSKGSNDGLIGDKLDASSLTTAATVTYTGAEAGTFSGSGMTGTFTEIERIATGSGNDYVNAGAVTGAGINVATGAGADTIIGGSGADTIDAGDGNDVITGGAGADSIVAGAGDDHIILANGFGHDTLVGGFGADSLDGTALTNNVVIQMTGNGAGTYTDGTSTLQFTETERFGTGSGNDTIDASATSAPMQASTGAGADSVVGGSGNDYLLLGDGNDTFSGGLGADFAAGGSGADSLVGGAGNDTMSGEAGSDRLEGGDGTDSLSGGADADTLSGGTGTDRLDGGDGADVVGGGTLGANGTWTDDGAADTLTGGLGNDVFIAGNNDRITDFGTGSGSAADGDPNNNDVVDLSAYYNERNLAIWNANHPNQTYATPLGWLRADQADGQLNMLDGTNGLPTLNMTISNNGTVVAADSLTEENTRVPCFTVGTMIETGCGPVPVETLRPGDLVATRDRGLQPVRWIGRRDLSAADLVTQPALRPIRIRKGALGKDMPSADLLVSPQHRLLVRSRVAERMFGAPEVLVAAKQLCQIDGIDIAPVQSVSYVHILFDRHEVVVSNGAETESLFTGPEALRAVGPAAAAEIFAIFPQLRQAGHRPVPARPLASGRMGRSLAVRHAAKGRALVM